MYGRATLHEKDTTYAPAFNLLPMDANSQTTWALSPRPSEMYTYLVFVENAYLSTEELELLENYNLRVRV